MNASSDRLLRRTPWGNAAFLRRLGRRAGDLRRTVRQRRRASPRRVDGSRPRHPCLELLGLGRHRLRCALRLGRPRARRCRSAWARVIFAADIAWVAGSVLVLALPATWTTAGIAGIVVVALIVADLAILEYLGLRRLYRQLRAPRRRNRPWTSFSS